MKKFIFTLLLSAGYLYSMDGATDQELWFAQKSIFNPLEKIQEEANNGSSSHAEALGHFNRSLSEIDFEIPEGEGLEILRKNYLVDKNRVSDYTRKILNPIN